LHPRARSLNLCALSLLLIAMDTVCIEDLRVDTVVGAYAWERQLRQPLLIGVRLGYDNRAVTALDAALDYASVAQALREHVAARTDQLLETLAESCCVLLAGRFHPRSIELRIDKPMAAAALGCARVGVCVRRDYA
jgi:dihydroneopterin aldolase